MVGDVAPRASGGIVLVQEAERPSGAFPDANPEGTLAALEVARHEADHVVDVAAALHREGAVHVGFREAEAALHGDAGAGGPAVEPDGERRPAAVAVVAAPAARVDDRKLPAFDRVIEHPPEQHRRLPRPPPQV